MADSEVGRRFESVIELVDTGDLERLADLSQTLVGSLDPARSHSAPRWTCTAPTSSELELDEVAGVKLSGSTLTARMRSAR